ncbi:ABC transporter permease [Chloroflexi bacterium TSY]|nr:ABC transporter permease [Chloroflexi bacterium TSY]
MSSGTTWQSALQRTFSEKAFAGPLLTLVAIFVLSLLLVPNFATLRTTSGIVSAIAISGFVTIGVTLLMIGGEFDLSVGPMLAMGGYIFGAISTGADMRITYIAEAIGLPVGVENGSVFLGILFALLVPMLMGLLNGLLRISTEIPSFIVTLGTHQIYRGLVWIAAGGTLLQVVNKPLAFEIFNGRFDWLNDLLEPIGRANFRTSIVWLVVAVVIFELILIRTRFGNHLFAVGGNTGAAMAQGIRAARVRVMAFMISGLMAGLAGIVSFSQFASVRVAEQAGIELTAIAASVVGGALLTGGSGSVWGALIGILLLNVLRSAVILLKIPFIPADNFLAVVGVAIIGAVIGVVQN